MISRECILEWSDFHQQMMVKMNCHANGSRDVKLRILLDDDMNGVTMTNAGVRERAAKENDAEELRQPHTDYSFLTFLLLRCGWKISLFDFLNNTKSIVVFSSHSLGDWSVINWLMSSTQVIVFFLNTRIFFMGWLLADWRPFYVGHVGLLCLVLAETKGHGSVPYTPFFTEV